jgi:hypothetical protein
LVGREKDRMGSRLLLYIDSWSFGKGKRERERSEVRILEAFQEGVHSDVGLFLIRG